MTEKEYRERLEREAKEVGIQLERDWSLSDEDTESLSIVASAMQLALQAMEPAIVREEGAFMCAVSTGGVSYGAVCGKPEAMVKALVTLAKRPDAEKRTLAAILMYAALKIDAATVLAGIKECNP